MTGINQQNYYEMAHKIISDLMQVCTTLSGTEVDIQPMVDIMQKAYTDYILPIEWEEAQKNEKD